MNCVSQLGVAGLALGIGSSYAGVCLPGGDITFAGLLLLQTRQGLGSLNPYLFLKAASQGN